MLHIQRRQRNQGLRIGMAAGMSGFVGQGLQQLLFGFRVTLLRLIRWAR
ncbi:MAG: hypothetical protein R3E95_09135 [Thiolinea sp.]